MIRRNKNNKGFSLIEILVVIFVFAILATVAVQSLALTIRGTKKSESVIKSRENVQYAVNVMDRQLRNARSISCPVSGTQSNRIDYTDQYGSAAYFQCVTTGTDSYIASNSASNRLTSNEVRITNCATAFTCSTAVNVPDSIDIVINALDINSVGSEGSAVTVSTKILLRNY